MEVTIKQLLEAGVHFGHQEKRWNPKMREFIYTQRNGIHIIDLSKTVEMLEKARSFIEEQVASGKQIVLIGTKNQASDIVKREAERASVLYVSNRWPGGLISNFSSIKKTIDSYKKMLEKKELKQTDTMTKKDLSLFNKDIERKEKLVGGLINLIQKPDLLFVLDVKREAIAIKEARAAGIPVVAICDTNSDPDLVTIAIPGNDDAIKSIEFFVSYITDAILEGKKKYELRAKQEAAVRKETIQKIDEKKVEEKKPLKKATLQKATLKKATPEKEEKKS